MTGRVYVNLLEGNIHNFGVPWEPSKRRLTAVSSQGVQRHLKDALAEVDGGVMLQRNKATAEIRISTENQWVSSWVSSLSILFDGYQPLDNYHHGIGT